MSPAERVNPEGAARTPRGADIAATLALGALAAALAALPAVRRVTSGGVSPGVVWLGLAGSTALVLGPLLVLARATRRSTAVWRPAFIGVALAAAPVMALGEELKLHTHHRPLGAATFGALALALVLGSVLVTVRLFYFIGPPVSPARRIAARVLVAVAALGLGLVVLRTGASEAYGADVLDVARLLIVATLADRALDSPRIVTLARRAGVFAWVLLVLVGLIAARGDVRVKIRERAPALGGPAAWL